MVTELLFVVYELATWKVRLKSKLSEGLKKWQENTLSIVIGDFTKLKEENIETIRKIADDIAHTFDDLKAENFDECYEHYIYAQQIGKKLGIK